MKKEQLFIMTDHQAASLDYRSGQHNRYGQKINTGIRNRYPLLPASYGQAKDPGTA